MTDIELPIDAEGHEIPLDTKVLYSEDGKTFNVHYYTYSVRQTIPQRKWEMVTMNCIVHNVSDLYLTPPDSWEKLLDDLDAAGGARHQGVCDYFNRDKDEYCCTSCPGGKDDCVLIAMRDIADRIRKLRGEDE